ncbi:MAG: SGNH/GDSL hydrolase family protein [Lachnospiraceae bacterium]|nr:SGNH/GDSL hydrolase family protein [Lachnospiraceae bacterium]
MSRLYDVLEHIIEKVNKSVKFEEGQILTDAEKQIVLTNLGLTNITPGTPTPSPEETITTEYVYTYDGDTNSEEHSWITNYSNIKVFAKMGDIPTGNLNLIGATIFRTNPSNQWLDRIFTITQEHLDKVLNKAETDIPAVQEGLIQIYDMMASDFSEFTVLCICTKPGWYNVCFDDWYEIINFPETGIYAYDKRTYGGNDYAQTFTFSVTTTVNNSGSNDSSIEGIDTSIPTQYNGNEISMFSRGICIGDSVTEGSFDNADGGAIVKRFSYPAILERITGVEMINAGVAGLTSQTWYEATLDSTPHWGTWVNQEWVWDMNPVNSGNDIISKSLDYSNFDFAIIHLGINDLAPLYDNSKTIEEILTTFETYIGYIIRDLKAANSGIKIFLATIIPSYATPSNLTYKQLNEKIAEIANATENTFLLDLTSYSALASKPEYNVTHPTALGYHKLANEIKSYISYIISKNLDNFTNIQFINLL